MILLMIDSEVSNCYLDSRIRVPSGGLVLHGPMELGIKPLTYC